MIALVIIGLFTVQVCTNFTLYNQTVATIIGAVGIINLIVLLILNYYEK